MESHRYSVGETVRFVKASQSGGIGGTPAGNFRVVSRLPNYEGSNQYRVQSITDGHERVVTEGEIALQGSA